MRWLPLVLAIASAATASATEDFIVLKTGESTVCNIRAVTNNIVQFSLITNAGTQGGSAYRTIETDRVEYIEFGFEPGEKMVFDDLAGAELEAVEKWWDFHFPHLHRPRSRTAAYGIALGKKLITDTREPAKKRGLDLFDRIIEQAWSETDKAAARNGRLQALIALDDLETATIEAKQLARETEDPELLIEVKHLLAEADFAALRNLVEENPKWEEDNEVRPERNELYHATIDQFLWPHLFYATRTDAAARGLFSASEVYRSAGETALAIAALTDLVRLYPEADSVDDARQIIETLSQPITTETDNP